MSVGIDIDRRPTLAFYLSVGLIAGAIIALQIGIMRIFSVGSWAHFGSLVVSLAMFGFGLTSAIMCIGKAVFERHWANWVKGALFAFGPLMVASNLVAQLVPFNAIFLVSDPMQKWRLFANFLLYFTPFLAGALYLGCVFLKAQKTFGRVYFADLAGSGLCGLLFLVAMYVFAPENLVMVPLALWFVGSLLWFVAMNDRRDMIVVTVIAVLTVVAHYALPTVLDIPKLYVSQYKGVSYARNFPDARRVVERATPFGYMEVYASSYLHFAPGQSDTAAFNLPEMPKEAYLGLYIDSDGPSGVIKELPESQTGYFRFLPMYYPYVLKKDPQVFVAQFGGGISTAVALRAGAQKVTVAEGNPMVLNAFLHDKALREFTGDVLRNPKIQVIDYEGRLYVAHTRNRYDIVDLSLADSAGLSQAGGFSIVEKFSYTREAMRNYMRALKEDGVLSVTLWNKEEPPKSVLKLYATMAAAARDFEGKPDIADRFYVFSSYLSTATVLYKRGGFSQDEVKTLSDYTRRMSFDEIYAPGMKFNPAVAGEILQGYHDQFFFEGTPPDPTGPGSETKEPNDPPPPGASADAADPKDPPPPGAQGSANEPKDPPPPGAAGTNEPARPNVPATTMGRLAWHHLVHGGFDKIAEDYVFDTRELTNHQPYFAAYIKVKDLLRFTDRLELVQDEWGYLLLWATLAIAGAAALTLVMLPVVFGWRTIFSRYPGKFGVIVYFMCLGLGYIVVEVGLISHFILALSNATVSASVLITGMLVFSGLGSFVSERFLDRARSIMPLIFLAIGIILIAYGYLLDPVLDVIGTLPYVVRILCCLLIVFPPAFLMGFPMPTGMTMLSRLGKDHMFLWAWGINGCFSVIGAALVPIVSTSFGLPMVLVVGGCAYLLAIPAFRSVLLPLAAPRLAPA
jgi:SAM-dependent methyltransferase